MSALQRNQREVEPGVVRQFSGAARSRRHTALQFAALCCLTTLLLVGSAVVAFAAEIVVTAPRDSSGADTITFDGSLGGQTIALSGGQLNLTSNLIRSGNSRTVGNISDSSYEVMSSDSCSLPTPPVSDANPQTLILTNAISGTISNYSVPANDDRLLVAYTANSANAAAPTLTFGGAAMTAGPTRSATGGMRVAMYYLVLGSSASATVGDIVATGSSLLRLAATSFHSVDQSDPTDGENHAVIAGTATTISATINSNANGLVVDSLAYYASGATDIIEGSGQTLLFKVAGGTPPIYFGASTRPGAAPSVPMEWTIAGTPTGATGALVGMNLRGIAGCPEATADLSISKMHSADLVVPGGAITYTLTFTNAGPDAASATTISDSTPVSVTITGVTSSTFGGSVFITQTGAAPDFAWEVSDLPAGAGGYITLTGLVSPGAGLIGATITNTAAITASSDITPADNSSAAAFILAEGMCSATPDDGATVFTSADASAVQAAIDAASPSVTVKIAGTCVGVQPRDYDLLGVAGTYSQTGYISKTLTVMGGFTTADWSSSDPVANPTVLDGDASGQVLVIDAPGLAVNVVSLSVTNGYAGFDPDEGAGITIYTATVTVSNTQVYGNHAVGEGGGLSTIDGVVQIVNSAFYENYAECSGGAIENFDSHMTIVNSHIYTNTADCAGGGVSNVGAEASTWLTITNGTLIEDNFSNDGGGVYSEAASLVIDASSIAGNLAVFGGGISNYGDFTFAAAEVTLRNGAMVVDNHAVFAGGGIGNLEGNVTIDTSQVTSNSAYFLGGGIAVQATDAATLTVQNGSVINYNSTEGDGGGIYNEDGWVVIDDSEVAWNQAAVGGGIFQDSCACAESSTVITNGAVIKHNHAIDDGSEFFGEGGGIYNATGQVYVISSVVYSNTADQDGGGISSLDYLTITNSYIGANLSVYNDGGGVDADGPTWIYNSTIADNLAGEDGGGLDSDWNTYIENSLIIRNTAGVSLSLEPADGGGIHHYDGALVITGTQILSNSTATAGGGIYADWEITVTNSLVQGNRADLGGGVYVDWYAVAALDGVQVVSNTGVITGGGVFLDTGLLTVTHSTIAENATAGEGGGFYSTGVDNSLTISATRILSNTAGNGGALFQADGATTVNASCIVANSDVAVYYDGGVAPPLDAKSNWWGHPTGPSGAGPGFGDSTSDNVDFDDFLGAAILDCPTFTFPDLVIAKSTAPYVLRGGVVTYTLAFSNSGDGPAANVVISDAIPLSITVTGVTSSTTGGALVQTSAAPDLAWTLAELPAGAQGVITVTGVLAPAAPAGLTITNTATITASGEVTPGVHSSDAAFTVVQMNVFPAQPGVVPGGSVTISATVRPAIAGLTVNFSMISGTLGLSGPTPTDANGVATVQYTAGDSPEVVQIDGALAAAPAVRDRGILYVAVATVAGEIATAAGDPFTAGNLSPNHIVITKTGAGAPPLGWAEFGGNPCPAAAPGSRVVSPYVDVMVDDATDVTEVVVTLKYTDTVQAAQHKLFWCNLGVWQQVTGTVTVDEVSATLAFTVNNATTPAIFQLAGTPFAGVGATPTAATVGEFAAAQEADRVQLRWTTVSELSLYGFHLYRGTDAAGPGERITGDPLPSQGAGGLDGFAYAYGDFTPRPPETAFYYWLEELHSDGGVFRHGPQRVGGAGSLRVFLPAISQGGAVPAAEPPPAANEAEPAPAEPVPAEDSAGEVAPAEEVGEPASADEVAPTSAD
jgi:uncharacterized repeat protein (TIGR01451 family)